MEAIAPSCPRCGYDQSGAVAAWERNEPACCPLGGVCSECGLRFDWADVFRPAIHDVLWLYEHAPRWSLGLGRAWSTWRRALAARRFWRAVGVRQRTSIWRLAAWPLIVLLPFHLAGVAVVLWATAGAPWLPPLWWRLTDVLLAPLARLSTIRGGYVVLERTPGARPVLLTIIPLTATAWPLLMMLLGASRSRAALRMGHLVRAWVYSFWWLTPLAVVTVVDLAWAFAFGPFVGPGFGSVIRWAVMQADPALLLALLAWQAWWWRCAILDGWKLERARLIWALLLLPVLLVAVIAAALDMRVIMWLAGYRVI